MSDSNWKHSLANAGLAIPSLYFTTWALTYGWRLFVEPLGVPGIGKAQALGLLCLGAVLSGSWTIVMKMPDAGRTEAHKRWMATMLCFFQPLILWIAFAVYGWLGTL